MFLAAERRVFSKPASRPELSPTTRIRFRTSRSTCLALFYWFSESHHYWARPDWGADPSFTFYYCIFLGKGLEGMQSIWYWEVGSEVVAEARSGSSVAFDEVADAEVVRSRDTSKARKRTHRHRLWNQVPLPKWISNKCVDSPQPRPGKGVGRLAIIILYVLSQKQREEQSI